MFFVVEAISPNFNFFWRRLMSFLFFYSFHLIWIKFSWPRHGIKLKKYTILMHRFQINCQTAVVNIFF